MKHMTQLQIVNILPGDEVDLLIPRAGTIHQCPELRALSFGQIGKILGDQLHVRGVFPRTFISPRYSKNPV